MTSFLTSAALLAAALPVVYSHGFVQTITVGGTSYPGSNPNWFYQYNGKPATAGWYAYNQDNGFVSPDAYQTSNISCHKAATPGSTSIPVTAGSTITLQWNTWPDSHKGPVIDYLAQCSGDCSKTTADSLSFFKIDQRGLVSGTTDTGTWASGQLAAANATWQTRIPSNIAPGNYVLRHEIIALHSAGSDDGAQNYPQCINLVVSGSGTTNPCSSGADCRKGSALYKRTDPGILINIYTTATTYTIPGPALWTGLKKRVASRFFAE